MPTMLPPEHVADSLKLQADGRVDLFRLEPLTGGVILFTSDSDVTWQGELYEGIPMAFTGEEFDLEKAPNPELSIGQENVDLLPFKGLINDGYLEGGTLVRHRVLVDDIKNNRNVKQTSYFRIKRVSEYSRRSIRIILSSYSQAHNQTIPFRQYVPPAFPWVDL